MPLPEISVEDLAALGPEVRLIDVREPEEWEAGHVGHAEHVPLGLVPDRLDSFAESRTYVMCKSGGRSQRACEIVSAHGHDVVNVVGGFDAWMASGLDDGV